MILKNSLTADSGSTKTEWRYVATDGRSYIYRTDGVNPYYQTREEIVRQIELQLLPHLSHYPTVIRFYGAGCSPEKAPIVQEALHTLFPSADISVGSDMLGAARLTCGNEPGIVCILGTGSNSCYYNGSSIVHNVSPLGYILGDEGSGAVLGKILVGDVLKKQLPADLCEAFLHRFDVTPAALIEHVYRRPFPNRYLAQFAVFYGEHPESDELNLLLHDAFSAFVRRNLLQYKDVTQLPIHFVGSIAYHYADVLRKVLAEYNLQAATIRKTLFQQ